MKAETIMDAIGYLDEALLLEYDHLDGTEKKKNYFVYIGWAAAAACLCLVITLAAFQLFGRNGGGGGALAEKETQAPGKTEAPYSTESSRPTEPAASGNPQTEIPSPVTGSPAPLIVTDSEPQNPLTERPGIQDRNPDTERIPQPTGTTGTQAPATEAPEPIPPQTDSPESATAQPTQKPDWESMWTYFIAQVPSEMGGGLDDLPMAGKPTEGPGQIVDENESVPTETPDKFVSEEYFMQHASWSFTLAYGSGLYVVRTPLKDAALDQSLGRMPLHIRETEVKHLDFTRMVQVYTVKHIAKEAALAIEIDPWHYYLVYNSSYQPENMAAFMQDLCLRKTVRMLDMELPDAENPKHVSDNDRNWDVLYAYDGAVKSNFDETGSHCCMRIELMSSVYGFDGMTVSLYSDGYVVWHMLGHKFCFKTDPAMAEQLMALYENAY